MKGTKEQNRGITLIALVITIIVMLILVAVTISMAVNGGLFEYAGKAVGETQNALDEEQSLADGGIEIDGKWYNSIDEYLNGTDTYTLEELGLKIGDTINLEANNVLTAIEGTHTSYYAKTGALGGYENSEQIDQSFSTSEMDTTWQVLREEEGNIVLIGTPSSSLKLASPQNYVYGPDELHELCQDLFKYTDKDGNIYKANSFTEQDLFELVGKENMVDYGIVASGSSLWDYAEEVGEESVEVPIDVDGNVSTVSFNSADQVPSDLVYSYYVYEDNENSLLFGENGSYQYWIASRFARK